MIVQLYNHQTIDDRVTFMEQMVNLVINPTFINIKKFKVKNIKCNFVIIFYKDEINYAYGYKTSFRHFKHFGAQ